MFALIIYLVVREVLRIFGRIQLFEPLEDIQISAQNRFQVKAFYDSTYFVLTGHS